MPCVNVKYLKETASVVAPGLGSRVALHDLQLDAGPKPIPSELSSRLMAIQSAVMKYLDSTSGDVITGLDIPSGTQ